jgi:hypothetical protein
VKSENGYNYTVKFCEKCNRAWEKEGKNILIHVDFPTLGLRREVCKNCKKEDNERD